MANVSQGEGMARPTRYLVRFNMPNNIVIDNNSAGEDNEGNKRI